METGGYIQLYLTFPLLCQCLPLLCMPKLPLVSMFFDPCASVSCSRVFYGSGRLGDICDISLVLCNQHAVSEVCLRLSGVKLPLLILVCAHVQPCCSSQRLLTVTLWHKKRNQRGRSDLIALNEGKHVWRWLMAHIWVGTSMCMSLTTYDWKQIITLGRTRPLHWL